MTAATPRPLLYDLTYVAARLHATTPTGIERVDAAFAGHFAGASGRVAAGVHYGLARPHILSPAQAGTLVRRADAAWRSAAGTGRDPVFERVATWLRAEAHPTGAIRATRARSAPLARLFELLDRTRWRLATSGATVPPGALYLNVAQYAFEYPLVFRWLEHRPDVTAVFFIHDLLPLDHPEFFRAGYEAVFERRVRTMVRYASAVLVSSQVVADRVEAEFRRRGRPGLPILAAPLPPPAQPGEGDAGPLPGAAPYFVALGTIEPRKNQLLLLHLWRDLARGPGPVPRLVLIGARGWDNEQVVDLLERCRAIGPHVIEVSGIDTAGLQRLIGGARALLTPSFDEGYGLPVAEALSAGTPVVASDIPVFREVSQGRALLLDPTDGPGWRAAVADMAQNASALRETWATAAARYRAPTWPDYFERVARFLESL